MKHSRALISLPRRRLPRSCRCSHADPAAVVDVVKVTKTPLTLMFGSSGPAETKAVNAAAAAFTKQSGIKVKVIAASNLTQQLAQGFAAGHPPDVFYLDPGTFQNYAKDNALYPYAQTLPNANDFYPALRAAFTYKGTFICDPKDASTLALYINTADWHTAGLTSADIPTNWSQLAAGGEEAHHGEPDRPGARPEPLGARRVPLPERRHGRRARMARSSLTAPQNVGALDFLKKHARPGHPEVPARAVVGLERSGLRGKQGRHGHRRQLDGRRDADRLPEQSSTRSPTIPAGPTGTAATLVLHQLLGHSPVVGEPSGGAVNFVKFLTSPAAADDVLEGVRGHPVAGDAAEQVAVDIPEPRRAHEGTDVRAPGHRAAE